MFSVGLWFLAVSWSRFGHGSPLNFQHPVASTIQGGDIGFRVLWPGRAGFPVRPRRPLFRALRGVQSWSRSTWFVQPCRTIVRAP